MTKCQLGDPLGTLLGGDVYKVRYRRAATGWGHGRQSALRAVESGARAMGCSQFFSGVRGM